MGRQHETRAAARGLRVAEQGQVVARVLEASDDHLDATASCSRASESAPRVLPGTVCRMVKLFEVSGVIVRLESVDRRAQGDGAWDHHDHAIDLNTGAVIAFCDPEIEALQERIARRLRCRLAGRRLEPYAVPVRMG